MNGRVAIFVPTLKGGGAERVAINLAAGFLARGHEVDVIAAALVGDLVCHAPAKARLVDLGVSPVTRARTIVRLAHYLRSNNPSVLIAIMAQADLVAVLARLIARKHMAVVLTFHNPLTRADVGRSRWRRMLWRQGLRFAASRAHAIVAVSSGVADDVAAHLGLPRAQIQVVLNPVVSGQMLAGIDRAPAHPWLRPGPPVILTVGRLVEQKDQLTLLRAFGLLRMRRRARLLILGEGPEREKLAHLAATLGVAGDVDMPGYVDEPYRYMKRAACFALSSRWEGFGNVVVEAMACGTPVVVTDCDGPREILEDGRWGRIVAVGDARSLAHAIEDVLDHGGPDARSRAAEFGIDRIARKYEALVAPIAGEAAG